MNKLPLADASFLYAETDNSPMHVAGLQLLAVPADQRLDWFDSYRSHLQDRLHLLPFMQRRLQGTPLGLDHPVWVDDSNFDLDYHLRRIALPQPGSMAQLESLVARLHARPLDRSRPLWEFYVIEGVNGDTVALYSKYHHACIDGMAGQGIVDLMFSESTENQPVSAPVVTATTTAPGGISLVADAWLQSALQPLRTVQGLPKMARIARRLLARAMGRNGGLGAFAMSAPKTRFNKAIGKRRSVSFATLPLGEMKAVGKALGGYKLNDLFMAVCAGAIRRYLDEQGELPAEPLLTGAPVSLRQPGDSNMNNQVTMFMGSLATDIADPLARLEAIRAASDIGKAVVDDMEGTGLPAAHALALPVLIHGLAQTMENLRLGNLLNPAMNVVISNVPGPRTERFLNGARMLSHWPVSIPAHSAGMNITVQSYCDRMDFSITACADALPDAGKLTGYMLDAFAELQALAAPAAMDAANEEQHELLAAAG